MPQALPPSPPKPIQTPAPYVTPSAVAFEQAGEAAAAPGTAPGALPRAHAWVSAGKVKVAGFPVEPAMVVVARFD